MGDSGAATLSSQAAKPDRVRLFENAKDFEYWQVPYPKGPGGKGLSSSTNMHIVSFAAQARNPDRAFEFIRALAETRATGGWPTYGYLRPSAWTRPMARRRGWGRGSTAARGRG
jgi:ABC-type glycerol-3-phosphate transport system substrate-binding protein